MVSYSEGFEQRFSPNFVAGSPFADLLGEQRESEFISICLETRTIKSILCASHKSKRR